MADFDSLIELITTTIKPDSWEDVGGAGTIQEFRSGVLVDTDGLLQRIDFSRASGLADIRSSAVADLAAPADSVGSLRASSQLRKVSLSRLEREVQLRAAQGLPPDAAMLRLAGIYRIKYLLVYPESGEVVIAGPAGDWRTNTEGRAVNMQTGAPLLHLDDLGGGAASRGATPLNYNHFKIPLLENLVKRAIRGNNGNGPVPVQQGRLGSTNP